MSPKRAALALLLVGVVLLPGPAYAVGLDRLDGPDRHRSSTGYTAEPVDASNDSRLADRYAGRLAFRPESMGYRHVAADYRAPNRTRRVLERAVADGTASTANRSVRADLRRLERNHPFLTVEYDAYYSYAVSSASGNATVRTERADESTVAAAVRERLVVDAGALPPAERRTFRKIRNATGAGEYYRPWADEPVPDEPVVERDGTHYAVEVAVHVDDFDFPDGLLAGVAASLVGAVALVAAGGVALYARFAG